MKTNKEQPRTTTHTTSSSEPPRKPRKKQQVKRPVSKEQGSNIPPAQWVKQRWKEGVGLLIILSVGLFLFARYGTHQVSGQSMEPTFQDKDRILIQKGRTPQRYDIVTLEPPNKPEESYVKRVIGMPGDHLILRGTTLYLVPGDLPAPEVDPTQTVLTDLPDGTQVIDVSKTVASTLFNYKNIPEAVYFVEGDNRDHSLDSRSFGWVNEEKIEGVVFYRYYPWSTMGTIR